MSEPTNLVELTAEIVSAYVSRNPVAPDQIPQLIAEVYAGLRAASSPKQLDVTAQPPRPAVPIRKSITPDFLISLENGKRLKSLKRHLASLGLTPDEYRRKWGLPPDYPMVAASYAKVRAELARVHKFGRSRQPRKANRRSRQPRRANRR